MLSQHLEVIENQLNKASDGYFSILLIGERGTGKSKILSGDDFIITTINDVETKLKELNKEEKIVIDLIEYLDFEDQKKLFHLLSTTKGNLLHNVEGNHICPQLIFTTQVDLKDLYEDSSYYTPFIDRIAQQVFVFKPIRKLNKEELLSAWQSVNELMKLSEDFEVYGELLNEHNDVIIDYVSTELTLSGNFRDLEKLAISLWRWVSNAKSVIKNELKIELDKFKSIHELELKGEFFKPNTPADEMIKDFRQSMVEWAELKYEKLTRAELINKLSISEKTYYNWKNRI